MARSALLGSFTRSRARRWISISVALVVLLAIAFIAWPSSDPKPVATQDVVLPVAGGAGEDATINIDATVYLPDSLPAPAIIMAHGLGGSKNSVAADAEDLARSGYLVLAYSARGFGASGGHIHLDSLDYEAQDAKALVDYLSTRSDVVQDGPGDPRVGVTGGSYGGAVTLMLAGIDPRVDAAVPLITWHSLADALFPNYATPASGPAATVGEVPAAADGVFKRYWAAVFMTSITSGSLVSGAVAGLSGGSTGAGLGIGTAGSSPSAAPAPAGGPPSPDAMKALAQGSCGRVAVDVCVGYNRVAESGRLDSAMTTLLANSSPAAVVGNITAPTLIIQGERDTLFGLDHADANARAIAANGTDVSVIWFSGGHDGGGIDDGTRASMHAWFDHYLARDAPAPNLGFRYNIDGSISDTGNVRSRTLSAPAYPGLAGAPGASIVSEQLSGNPQPVINPPGGTPAAISSLPGLGATASTALATLGADIPGQSARFTTTPLAQQLLLTGSAKIDLSITPGPSADQLAGGSAGGASTSSESTSEATFFVKLYKVSNSGIRTLAGGAASPIRVTGLAVGQPTNITVNLTPVALQIDAGSTIEVVVATTDQAFAVPNKSASYLIGLGTAATISIPVAGGSNISTSEIPIAALIGLIALLIVALGALIVGAESENTALTSTLTSLIFRSELPACARSMPVACLR
ncbi:alpha/beta fold hydrolase [Nakamurella antarctica]|uniref:alpha/beta fold hydrolase n=1 Tax=Nakamurella antarctica TaxID=1902245 RepID=UPI0019CF8246|nr:alpha/beta fold hydrolase [Nakamurella antarctica]